MEGTPKGVDKLDLENMPDGQLQELLSAVKQAISERVERRVADLQNLAREAGFDVQLHRSSTPSTGQNAPARRLVCDQTGKSLSAPNTEILKIRLKPGRGGGTSRVGCKRSCRVAGRLRI